MVETLNSEYGTTEIARFVDTLDEANVITSLTGDGTHAPVLDIDYPMMIVPSSTKGHYHLYLDRPMTWRKYKRLLRALARAGIIERGYARASIKRGWTAVRKPGEVKPTNKAIPEDPWL